MKAIRLASLALGLAIAPTVATAQVLDLGGGGAFTNTISPGNTGRATGAFWDNASADQTGAASQCNLGWFATGTLSAGCLNQALGTFANQGGFAGGSYWGESSGGDGRAPAPYMFSGKYSYDLRLVGSIAGLNSEIGIFTITGAGYVFTPIVLFGNKVVGSTYQVASGADWGFYIRNSFNPQTGGCNSPDYDCSDATGTWPGDSDPPWQQWALMRTSGPGKWGTLPDFLAGAEDNRLELLPNGFFYDSDFNDYIISVTVTPEPMSMALVATGLVGLAGAGLIRRRRERQNG
jgi:MYXO-CTERM domain-containing protein